MAFKPLAVWSAHDLLGVEEDGYLIICEDASGKKRPALFPLRDCLGNPTGVDRDKTGASRGYEAIDNKLVIKSNLGVEPGNGRFILRSSQKYVVAARSPGKVSVLWTSADSTCDVEIAEADVDFLSLQEYTVAVRQMMRDLEIGAKAQLAKDPSISIRNIFLGYDGRFAEDTTADRASLAERYEAQRSTMLRDMEQREQQAREQRLREEKEARERFEKEQTAKGLVKFEGSWISAEEFTRINQKREDDARREREEKARQQAEMEKFEAAQRAKGLINYGGEWITQEEATRRKEETDRAEVARREFQQRRAIVNRLREGNGDTDDVHLLLDGKTQSEVRGILGQPDGVIARQWIYKIPCLDAAAGVRMERFYVLWSELGVVDSVYFFQ